MSETDGVDETLDENVRVAVVAAGRAAEALVRMREQQLADARAQSEQATREYTERLHAERETARAQLEPVHHQQWWDRADAAAIGQAYTTARAWQDFDPEAARAHDRIRDEVRKRYSIDVDKLDADPAAVREAMALCEALRERAAQEEQTAQAERAQAAVALQEVDRADRAAQEARERAATATDPQEARDAGLSATMNERVSAQTRRDAAAGYDSADRREEFARAMRRDGVSENLIAVRLRADAGEARPATDAVAPSGRSRSRGHDAGVGAEAGRGHPSRRRERGVSR